MGKDFSEGKRRYMVHSMNHDKSNVLQSAYFVQRDNYKSKIFIMRIERWSMRIFALLFEEALKFVKCP